MPGPKRQRVASTDDWHELRLHLDWPEQIAYELIRPVVIFGRPVVQRAKETGAGVRAIRRKADRFDELGMASLFPPQPQGTDETPDRREIPRQLRQLLTDLKREHPAFRAYELATIGYVASGRRLDSRTVQRIPTSGLPPSRTTRRYCGERGGVWNCQSGATVRNCMWFGV
jgi:putative transposase